MQKIMFDSQKKSTPLVEDARDAKLEILAKEEEAIATKDYLSSSIEEDDDT